MIPWVHLDTASVPGGAELKLMRRGGEFSIMLGTNELMNSRLSGSERALATLACEALGDRPKPRLLIGGLGMGFTLRAALEVLGSDAEIVVAELVPAVVRWAKGPMAEIFAGCLSDIRVRVEETDVAAVIARQAGAFDAILLDVDNGPDGITQPGNDRLYSLAGLAKARSALRPGGVLAVWSSRPDAGFTRRLRDSRFAVDEQRVRANRTGRGARHTIWVATKQND
ncbi:spermidine synthase [Mangrovicella endophytica]|uniref:spermidine synthase n=1 Tax=Mangrovicella endophytica TaxID=2066697 RepID=UPI000C9E0BAE|nr:hypothetical protein [Mangrovicella endophytica]